MVKLLLIGGAVMSVWFLTQNKNVPRGTRNNNPLNIKHSDEVWEGESSMQTDPTFKQFVTPEMGIRAGAKLILNYNLLYGINKLSDVIERWAPDKENPTSNYIDFVSSKSGVPADGFVSLENLSKVIDAMIIFENGSNPYDQTTINMGIHYATV